MSTKPWELQNPRREAQGAPCADFVTIAEWNFRADPLVERSVSVLLTIGSSVDGHLD